MDNRVSMVSSVKSHVNRHEKYKLTNVIYLGIPGGRFVELYTEMTVLIHFLEIKNTSYPHATTTLANVTNNTYSHIALLTPRDIKCMFLYKITYLVAWP